MSTLFAFLMPGLPEMLIVGLIVLLLFGSRLPSTMRSLGRGMLEFKRGLQGTDEESDGPTEEKSS